MNGPTTQHTTRTTGGRRRTASRTRLTGLTTGVTAALAVATLSGCGAADSGNAAASALTSSEPMVSGVYYMLDTRLGPRLARELRTLPGERPGVEAVRRMIAGAHDPDYATAWNPRTKVLGVSRPGNVIRVNLPHQARRASIGSAGAALMVQQLVSTVTEPIDRKAPVRLLIDGRPAGELWGAVVWDEPVRRAAPGKVRNLVQIDTPRERATRTSPLRVRGEANAFEANVPWRVLTPKGRVVRRGNATTAEGFRFAPFTFTVRLRPGTFVVEVSEDDPSAGEAGPPMTDDKTVVIR
jgi:hypothetical protein